MKTPKILRIVTMCGWLLGFNLPLLWAEEMIVFSRLSPDGYWQIWTMSPDGAQARQLTTSPVDKREPSLSLDGKILYRTPNGQAFMMDGPGGAEQEILRRYERVNNPQLFNDGKSVLFTRLDARAKDIRDILKADLDGHHVSIVTRDTKMALQPDLSPDNLKIAFVKGDELRTSHHVWIMDMDGKNARQLTSGVGQDLFARFSPDGKSIVHSTNKYDGNFEIYSVDIKTQKLKRLTNNPAGDTQPYFSPDGAEIVFVSSRGGDQQIWVMDKDGGHVRPLTQGPGESVEPSWKRIEE